uniref:Clade I nitrous oxide reductase n=1 Tax=Parastrongyloides trichosuri TaxID=131310 RepID=A0A0N4ZXP7_PARTI
PDRPRPSSATRSRRRAGRSQHAQPAQPRSDRPRTHGCGYWAAQTSLRSAYRPDHSQLARRSGRTKQSSRKTSPFSGKPAHASARARRGPFHGQSRQPVLHQSAESV